MKYRLSMAAKNGIPSGEAMRRLGMLKPVICLQGHSYLQIL